MAEALVDQEPTDRELRGHRYRLDEFGVTALDQLFDRCANREVIHGRLVVNRQRVVHVEADPADPGHFQVPVAENAVWPGNTRSARVARGEVVEWEDEL